MVFAAWRRIIVPAPFLPLHFPVPCALAVCWPTLERRALVPMSLLRNGPEHKT